MQKFRECHKDDPKYIENKKKWNKITWERHGDKYRAKHREWWQKNKNLEAVKKKIYRKEHKEEINEWKKEYNKQKRQTDIQFLIKSRLRCLLYNSVRLYGNGANIQKSKKYGLDWKEICEYLESIKPNDFEDNKYHIDHIIPVSSFDLSKKEEVKKAFDKSNLQWLTAEENIRKSNKIE